MGESEGVKEKEKEWVSGGEGVVARGRGGELGKEGSGVETKRERERERG